jgi:hypothetical protein
MPRTNHPAQKHKSRYAPVHYGYDEHENYNEDVKDYGGQETDQRSNKPPLSKKKALSPSKKRH